ncbi:hypothetical protein HMPREF0682_1142 [Propionibacterium acidifaciens F0233]|uniref:Winged helix-turn helix n=1 Tax=Propionibacterium acidifaciens F0233 TaxID=553198 RepID=U2SAN2_9ACTN|nr:hypothetical protein HMPREF0682_1142 [Propionibacterium acidifaciens F0233]
MGFLCCFGHDRGMQVGVTLEETAVLVRWKKRSDNHVLVRMKTEAVLHASRGVDVGVIAGMVERAERTVQEWPAEWRATRMRRVPAGHAGNQDAAEPARAQKEELETVLARPPSQAGVHAEFWDVPTIRDVVKTLSDAEHRSDSSYRLLPRLCGPSLEPPGPVRRAPRRESRHPTHGLGDDPGQGPVGSGPEGPHRKTEARPEHEAWTRRMQPPKGQRTRPSVDRQKTSQSFPDALPDQQNSHAVPDRAEPEHLADDPRTGPAPTRNRGRQDRGRPGQRPLPPCESVDRPPRARPAAGAHHPCFPAAVRARPQPRRARPERGQEQHRHHPARDPRRNLRNIRLIHRQPNIRLRLRAPPTPRNQKRSCSMTAIDRFRLSR